MYRWYGLEGTGCGGWYDRRAGRDDGMEMVPWLIGMLGLCVCNRLDNVEKGRDEYSESTYTTQ